MIRLGFLLAALLLAIVPARAERVETIGDYQVHYNAFPSAFLKPEVAQAYRLLRSRVQGVVTVSVLKHGVPVPARVSASATNEVGQQKSISLRQVRETHAIYQIGNVGANEGEVLRFVLEVLPEHESKPFTLRFSQQFFGD